MPDKRFVRREEEVHFTYAQARKYIELLEWVKENASRADIRYQATVIAGQLKKVDMDKPEPIMLSLKEKRLLEALIKEFPAKMQDNSGKQLKFKM